MARGNMIRTLDGILAAAKGMARRRTVVLAGAEQEEGLKSLNDAFRQGIVRPVLIGDRRKLARLARSLKISLRSMEVIDEPDPVRATQQAVAMCRQGQADILMKGLVSTDMILRAVLDRQTGLATGKLLSHVAVFESPTHKRLMFMSDPAVNVNPDVSRKLDIIKNAVIVAQKLGLAKPKVALLAATERINVKDMPATTDAAIIAQMYESGQLTARKWPVPTGWTLPSRHLPPPARTWSGRWPAGPTSSFARTSTAPTCSTRCWCISPAPR